MHFCEFQRAKQPDDWGSGQDCVAYSTDTWLDGNGNGAFDYVCSNKVGAICQLRKRIDVKASFFWRAVRFSATILQRLFNTWTILQFTAKFLNSKESLFICALSPKFVQR